MNKTITHRFLNREVILCYNFKKELICYVLNSVTPNYKRVLFSSVTKDKSTAKKFLNLID